MKSRLSFMELDESQRQVLRSTQPFVEATLSDALDKFYARAAMTPETSRFFRDQAHMNRAKAAQEKHWARISAADFNHDYYASARRIGATHAHIGLEPRWYVGSYAILLHHLIAGVHRLNSPFRRPMRLFRGPSTEQATIALVKAALLDMEVSLSIYFEEAQAERDAAITSFENALNALAEGDLTNELSGLPKTFAALESSYNRTLTRIREIIGSVGEGTQRIRSGINEISQAAEDLSRRTQGNAASLEETTAAVTQMETRFRSTADAANHTVGRADQAIATVSQGRGIVDEAVQAMGRVSEAAKGTDSVIEGLDKIAFQTRVLAMNAAVEAGRAGEAGRGFAVVADLVSALAMRAEEEAGRAREQLTMTQAEIVTAVDAVQKVDGALANISGDVSQVHDLLGSMAADNAAQSTAISEISNAVGAMDRATQQNAAMVEQTSAAAQNLSSEVGELATLAAQFRTTGGGARSGSFRQLPSAAVAALTRPDL
ncbi:globin-coupled sensor protein [Sphingomonas pokkalii]|uniref:Chemotaxis protein n=1 Tax=Sphingomonas pokkalii TaxID=2175090 RepID=A0A2U0SI17_9SPHN|nr:globin-coupled sensor protein [Sphingomonas pokkalii]PVX30992.1 chemotaxis protein [Sphingomonas pokkalii]